MPWSCQSAFLPPVRLQTAPVTVFSIYMELPPEVEAELDYTSPPANRTDVLYRECFLPLEEHFPLLTKELILAADLPEDIKPHFARLLQAEFSRLREAGALGNVVILPQTLSAFIHEKIQSGEYLWPMEIAFARRPSDEDSHAQ